MIGIGLAAVLAGIYRPAVLTSPFFWLSTLAVSSGFLGIGMTVAALARTQRAAFLGSMCYLMSVSLFLFICSTNGVRYLPYAAVEFHGPRILHAAVEGNVESRHWSTFWGRSSWRGARCPQPAGYSAVAGDNNRY